MGTSAGYFAEIRAARDALSVLHPNLFDLEKPVPFAIGLKQQLIETYSEMPKRTLQGLLSWLTCRRAYLKACVPGAPRYGLDGQVGCVTAEQATYANERFSWRDKRARDKWADRVAA